MQRGPADGSGRGSWWGAREEHRPASERNCRHPRWRGRTAEAADPRARPGGQDCDPSSEKTLASSWAGSSNSGITWFALVANDRRDRTRTSELAFSRSIARSRMPSPGRAMLTTRVERCSDILSLAQPAFDGFAVACACRREPPSAPLYRDRPTPCMRQQLTNSADRVLIRRLVGHRKSPCARGSK